MQKAARLLERALHESQQSGSNIIEQIVHEFRLAGNAYVCHPSLVLGIRCSKPLKSSGIKQKPSIPELLTFLTLNPKH